MNDIRYALRLFSRHPVVIGATIGGLALAIAVSTTVFTILNATLLRPFGMDDPGSVVRVHMVVANGVSDAWPYHAFAGLRERATHTDVEGVVSDSVRFALSAAETPARRDPVQIVSGGYLEMLGGRAVRGRPLEESDDQPGAPPVVVLNHRFWTTRLNSDPSVVGQTVWLSGAAVTVVGILESSFTGPTDQPPAMWAPFGSYAVFSGGRPIERTSAMNVSVFARAGIDRTAAKSELSAIAAGLPDVGVRDEAGRTSPATGVALEGAGSPIAGSDSTEILVTVGAVFVVVGLVVALACINVANLLLAGAAARSREIGVRLALGASHGRVLRQLLAESVLAGVLAGGAGLLMSTWLAPVVTAMAGMPDLHDLTPDWAVYVFTTVLAVVSGIGAGLAPARHGVRGDLAGVLKSASQGAPPQAARMRRWFIGFQAAASILLLIVAALFLRGAARVTQSDLGFDADKLVTAAATFPGATDRAGADAYWQAARERARAMPSVEGASFVVHPPLSGSMSMRNINRGYDTYRIYENRTDATYFTTAGVRLTRGRAYSADEVRTNAPVAVVSENVVRDFLGGIEPIGASLSPLASSLAHLRVVGVVAEAVTARVQSGAHGAIYRPLPPADMHEAHMVLRTSHPSAVARDLERVLLDVNPGVRTLTSLMSHDVDRHRNEPKVLAGVSSAVAALAVLLSVLGLVGVATFVVSQRMWEMQVRRAIGASTADIVLLLVRQSLTPVVGGLAAGLVVALGAVPALAPSLSGMNPYDPTAILGALALLIVAAVGAVLQPALRASRANPASVLRNS